ncbi:integrase core domain-containing protein [uncultured Nitrosomonas sp.]|uniref:integrase core domain-containing protein n=1 Tax=uncultured Nitrosomonas sp. TaxID=156424 RepID=UPI003459BB62
MLFSRANCTYFDAKQGLEKYFMFYNQYRPHTALDDKTPNEFYFDNLPAMQNTA